MKRTRVLKEAGLAGILALLTAGCTGINSTNSVSPATFLLPGYMPGYNYSLPAQPGPLDLLTNSVSLGSSALAQR